jgi:hypothetical protein
VPLYVSPLVVETSGRRWDMGGFFRTWWQFRCIFFRYRFLRDAERAAEEYEQLR